MKSITRFLRYSAIFCAFTLYSTLSALGQSYELVWSDEFNGTSVDTSKWEFMIGDGGAYGLPSGWGNYELQSYQEDNATVAGGILTIEAREERHQGQSHTSARLRTKNLADFTFAKIEARIDLPKGQGMWAAFWMLPTNEAYGGWAASGEIDIMESINQMDEVLGTLHYGAPWPDNVYTGSPYLGNPPSTDFSQDFHVYGIEWELGVMRWYIDGTQVSSQNSWYSSAAPYPAPFDQSFHLLLNLAVGGNWPGNPDATTVFPQQMLVDWVRVYQLGGGTSTPTPTPASTPTPTPSSTPVHVADIAMSLATQGPSWGADATVRVENGSSTPTSGVSVDVTFSGFVSGTTSGVTSGSGEVTLSSSKSKGSGTITVTVDNLSGTGFSYDSPANVETSDSIVN